MDIPEVIFPGAQSNSQLQRRFEPEQEKKPGEVPARPKVRELEKFQFKFTLLSDSNPKCPNGLKDKT